MWALANGAHEAFACSYIFHFLSDHIYDMHYGHAYEYIVILKDNTVPIIRPLNRTIMTTERSISSTVDLWVMFGTITPLHPVQLVDPQRNFAMWNAFTLLCNTGMVGCSPMLDTVAEGHGIAANAKYVMHGTAKYVAVGAILTVGVVAIVGTPISLPITFLLMKQLIVANHLAAISYRYCQLAEQPASTTKECLWALNTVDFAQCFFYFINLTEKVVLWM